MATRPAVPVEVKREVMIESGHRCAVCGLPCPLEKAHIVPWRNCKEHSADNMICLCSCCHGRADSEDWGATTLLEYKRNPWIRRQFQGPSELPASAILVTIAITLPLDQFNDAYRRLLQFGIAGFLGTSPSSVTIKDVTEGSTLVVLEIPLHCYSRLLEGVHNHDPFLAEAVFPLRLAGIRGPHQNQPHVRSSTGTKKLVVSNASFDLGLDDLVLGHGIPDDPIAKPSDVYNSLSSLADLARRRARVAEARRARMLGDFQVHIAHAMQMLATSEFDRTTILNSICRIMIMADRLGLFTAEGIPSKPPPGGDHKPTDNSHSSGDSHE